MSARKAFFSLRLHSKQELLVRDEDHSMAQDAPWHGRDADRKNGGPRYQFLRFFGIGSV